jgi:hypothetical protein
MESRLLVMAGFVGGVMAGAALFVGALALLAIDGEGMNDTTMALLMLGTMLGFVLDATWLSLALGRLNRHDDRDEGEDGESADGWGRPGSDPPRPRPPFDEPDWWSEFERDFRAHVKEWNRPPIPR